MAIQCKKHRISFLSGHSFYLTLGEKVRGARGGEGMGLKVPGLNLNFPHFVTFPKSVRQYLGLSRVLLLALTFLDQPCL